MLPKNLCKNLKGIFSDIDDTISLQGKIPKLAYNALCEAKEAGLRVIPVTGRPAGWVDHLARMWPVDAVVGENGAFYFYLDLEQGRDGKLIRRFLQSEKTRESNRKKLWKIFSEMKKEKKHLQVASDQGYREIDIAVDFCEDVARLPEKEIDWIVKQFTRADAQVKISSIHVNAWFGKHDKASTCKLLLKELFKEDFEKVKDLYLYCGDSPNDEPLFQCFPETIGMANVKDFLPQMKYHPKYIAKKAGGLGFAETVQQILKFRT